MKKAIVKVIAMCVVLVTVVSCCVVSSSAALVPGRHYHTDSQSTAITETYGYSMGNFTGDYYSYGSSSNVAIVAGECKGGSTSGFETLLKVVLSDAYDSIQVDTLSSEEENTRLLSLTYRDNPDNFEGTANGVVEAGTISKTNTRDYWVAGYSYVWLNSQDGWTPAP